MNKKISVIIITYNNAHSIERCLVAVKNQQTSWLLKLLVVDNASTDQTVEIVQNFASAELIAKKDNAGFARAVNEAARQLNSKYILLLNPDAELRDGAIDNLVVEMEKNPQNALVGGHFISSNGKNFVSFGNFPNFWTEFFVRTRLDHFFPSGRYIRPSLLSNRLFKKSHQVNWVTGGFCLIKKEVFDRVGGFDEKFFLYFEDIDLAKRISGLGLKVVYCAQACAVHYQHRTSSFSSVKHERQSAKYYKIKHWLK